MDCADVEEARIRGLPLEGAAMEHAVSCPWCSRTTTAPSNPPPDEGLFASVEGSIAAERGLSAWLRDRSTRTRMLLAGFVMALVAALSIAIAPRSQYADVPWSRVILTVSVLTVLLLVLSQLALRPLHTPRPTSLVLWTAAASALFVPVLFAVLPARVPVPLAHVPFLVGLRTCFAGGILSGAVVLTALRLLDREHHATRASALLAAAAGGLAGNLALELHCAITTTSHLLLSHASLGFVLVALYGLTRRP